MASASASADAGTCPWDALPSHLQERILSLLPITELLPVAAVSRALRRLLRSPAFHALLSPHRLDAFFLLSPRLAVHPLSRRVLTLPALAALSPPSYPLVSSPSPSLLITCASLQFLPPFPDAAYLLSVIVPSRHSSPSCTLVAVTTGAAVRSYTLDTGDPSPRWASRGDLPLSLTILGNAAVVGDRGKLFVLGRGPDALLVFLSRDGDMGSAACCDATRSHHGAPVSFLWESLLSRWDRELWRSGAGGGLAVARR
ncbi:unnamed protein product [Miscanthus lutarioriparius]|uniref:F-box domain-containing protein n=1 Tax=Miscanthus lutarioriparius TaxID=422564 RepID=A0A811SPN9_9POAL|nr:unnamed protein product [Miscanthus lutarioriparius]